MRSSRLRLRRVLLTAAATLTLTAVSAGPAQALELGIQDDGAYLYEQIGNREEALNLAKFLGVGHIRVIVFWNRVAGTQSTSKKVPSKYHYNFTQLDSLSKAAAEKGIKLQLVLTGKSPAYATGDKKVGNFRPNPKLYAAWVKAVVSRYKGKGYRYSLWNEPNFLGWLQPLKEAPQLYRPLVEAGYKAAKQADPKAQVLVAELASFSTAKRSIAPLDFLEQMKCPVVPKTKAKSKAKTKTKTKVVKLPPCKRLPADGFAYHPYDLTHAPNNVPALKTQVTLGTLSRLFSALDKGGVFKPKLPVYLTEWGYAISGTRKVSLAKQATYTTQAWNLARRQTRVKELMQYGFYTRPGTSFDTGIFSYGLAPLPAFTALLNRKR